MTYFDVSIIIINYNSTKFTVNCVNSIIEKVDKNINYNIIIVDNNSEENEYINLKEFCSKIDKDNSSLKLIRSNINVGFSAGNMIGVQNSNSKYVFFLNNDTELINDVVSILYKFMNENIQVALATAGMYNSDLSYHSSFGFIPSFKLKIFGENVMFKLNPNLYPSRRIEYFKPLKVELVTGAAMFFRYEHFANIGGFDTNYFLYCEEEDIAKKLKYFNYEVYFVPDAKFLHHTGKSTKRNILIEKENFISLMYFFRKHNNYLVYSLWKLFYFIKTIRKFYKSSEFLNLAFFIINGANMKFSLKLKQKISKNVI
jgi:GT2 family glycosyltransferase